MQPSHEVYEEELSKMRARLEELYREVQRKVSTTGPSGGDIH
jgi:hypothetical protein